VRIGADPRQCDKHILWQAVRQVGSRAREQGKHEQQHRNKPTGSLKVFNLTDGSSCHVLDFEGGSRHAQTAEHPSSLRVQSAPA
jgi:hypothetical protein